MIHSVKVKGADFGIRMKAPPPFSGSRSQRLSLIRMVSHQFL